MRGLAGVLNRLVSGQVNLVNAHAARRRSAGWNVGERHEKRAAYTDSIRSNWRPTRARRPSKARWCSDKPRLIQVDGIYCEAPLEGISLFMKNDDVPGVIGHVGSVLGRNGINIANFSLGRRTPRLHPAKRSRLSPFGD